VLTDYLPFIYSLCAQHRNAEAAHVPYDVQRAGARTPVLARCDDELSPGVSLLAPAFARKTDVHVSVEHPNRAVLREDARVPSLEDPKITATPVPEH